MLGVLVQKNRDGGFKGRHCPFSLPLALRKNFYTFVGIFRFRMATTFQWITQGRAEMPPLDFPLIERWVREVAASRGRIVGPLTYIFCDDERILEVNRQFLNHDYYTDIITFDYCRGKLLRGDMFISLDTVATNAAIQGATFRQELLRVIIHGVLHLCGINDKGPGEREVMEAAENQSIELLDKLL